MRDEAWRALNVSERIGVAEVVLDCLRGVDLAAIDASMQRWTAPHWSAARHAVEVHGVGPLLNRALDRPIPDGLEPARAFAARTCALNVQRAALWTAELERLLDAAAHRGARIIPLKSAAIVMRAIDDASLRPTADIDLLVPDEPPERLDALWQELGYAFERCTPRHRAYYLRRLGPLPVDDLGEHPANPLRLEVHGSARQEVLGFAFDATPALTCPSSSARWRGTAVLIPDPAALLQHVAFHAAQDLVWGYGRFLKLRDVALLGMRCDEGAWRALADAARDQGAERFFFAALWLATREVGARPPPTILEELATRTPPSLRRHVERAPFSASSRIAADRRGLGAIARMVSWTFPGLERGKLVRRLIVPSLHELREIFGEDAAITRRWYYGRSLGHVLTSARAAARRALPGRIPRAALSGKGGSAGHGARRDSPRRGTQGQAR